jgi:hypothetical protein
MAEMPRQLTQAEIDRILFNQRMGMQPTPPSIENLRQGTSGTVTSIPDNFFQRAATGARAAGQFVNQAGTAADIAKLFPGYTGQSQVNIPTGFNFAPKQDPMGGVIPGGLQTQQLNVDQLLKAIKPADVLGLTGAQQAYTDVGMGKAPNPMDVLDVAGLGAVGYGAGKGLLKVGKNAPVGLSIQDVSKPSEFVPNVRAGDELIVQHNLSEANLRAADKLGGLPVPSLGVAKTSAPFDKFGEITLIAPKEFAIPSKGNPVFSADAYTKRFPAIDYQIDYKSQKTLKNILNDVANKIPGGDYKVDRLLQNWNDRGYSDVLAAKFLDERGQLPNPADFKESWEFESALRESVSKNSGEFNDWLEKFDNSLNDKGVNIKEKIFKGYTYSGNRRYADANLANIVKEMKGGAGEEGWNYGVGNVRAAVSPKFKKLQDIQASRGLLTDEKTISQVKDVTDKAYFDLLSRLGEIDKKYDASDALLEVAQTRNIGALDRIYGEVPSQLKADTKVFLDKFKSMPTEYFEIKPQRAVGIEEFSGAIIPKSASKKTKEILEKRGIKNVYEYETPEERASLMQKFGKEMFVAAPVGTGLLSSQQDERR